MTWVPSERPDPNICPEEFCFHWVPPDGTADLSGRSYDSLEEAIEAAKVGRKFPLGGCGCCFGSCKRLDSGSNTDWYEANEPALKQVGLPWFYFVSSLANLAEDFHEEFIRESTKLWGDRDGSKPTTD